MTDKPKFAPFPSHQSWFTSPGPLLQGWADTHDKRLREMDRTPQVVAAWPKSPPGDGKDIHSDPITG